MFCRFCGAKIQEDSVFCAKCGKRLGPGGDSAPDGIVRKLHLKTPYPYAALLILLFIVWAAWPAGSSADYSHLKWSFELDRKVQNPAEHSYQQALSLVVENTGPAPAVEIPIEIRATIDPVKPAEVEADFLGRRLLILQRGRPLPLTVVIAGTIASGGKKRVLINGNIMTDPPFKVTYEVRDENGKAVFASYLVEEE